jgi:hypothetical protein
MLGIEINKEFLDLPPDTSMELIEENPFLQFAEDTTIGNYSLPVEFILNEKNTRLTRYAGVIQKKIDLTGIEARLYGNGIQHSRGRLKIEKVPHNLNSIDRGRISAYYLTGNSDFYQDIKDKNMRSIEVGGDRTFAWDDFATSGPGFWGHLNTVMHAAVNAYDYAFFPVMNNDWITRPGDVNVMNYVRIDGSDFTPQSSKIVPFPYLHYVLKKAVSTYGWTIDGDVFSDSNFMKITLINFRSIDWAYYTKESSIWGARPRASITFNIQDHLPDMSIANFLTALKNRFGWWYDINTISKKITIRSLKALIASAIKEMTKYSSPLILKSVNQERKIYSLKNIFATSLSNGTFSLANVKFQGNINHKADLPAPAEALYSHCYLVVEENNYFVCYQNEDSGAWEWRFFAYNIYDYIPEGATEEVTTEATTVGVEIYEPNDNIFADTGADLIPRIDNQGEWPGAGSDVSSWGIHLCFYHGVKNSRTGKPYPYGSSHIYDSNFNQVADWSLTFECKKSDGSDVGLYEIAWKDFLRIVSNLEEFTCTLYLPYHEALKLKFSDRIIIENVMMFVRQIKRILPYKGQLQIEAVRIL